LIGENRKSALKFTEAALKLSLNNILYSVKNFNKNYNFNSDSDETDDKMHGSKK
jgi:hypothetical protein